MNGLDLAAYRLSLVSGVAHLEADLRGQLAGSDLGEDGEACAMVDGSNTLTDRLAISNHTIFCTGSVRLLNRSADIPLSTR